MRKPTPAWLTTELEWGLHETSAPPELWDRVVAAQRVRRGTPGRSRPVLAWAAAIAMLVVAIGFASAYRQSTGSDRALAFPAAQGASQIAGLHCQNPAELRAWVRADSDVRNSPHDRTSVQRFTLIANTSADFQTGCKLCHLD